MSGIRGERYIDDEGNEVLTGGLRTAKTNKEKFGNNFYAMIGRKGGRARSPGGFAANRELAKMAGAKGGRHSKRGDASIERRKIEEKETLIRAYYFNDGMSIPDISRELNISCWSLRKWANENLEGYNRAFGESAD